MRIQKITNTPIITPKNRQGNLVSFSGKKVKSSTKSMPKFEAKVPKVPKNREKTLFEEIGNLAKDIWKSIKNSYNKSEIKKLFAEPVSKRWNKFTQKSPKLVQAVKGAALMATGAVIYDIASAKLKKEDDN